MYLISLAFIAGVLTLPYFTAIPNFIYFLPAFIVTSLGWYFSKNHYKPIFTVLFSGLAGCVFVLLYSQSVLRWELPENLETKTITLIGTIVSLPTIESNRAQFTFAAKNTRIQLSWYQYSGIPLHAGDTWQFQVRLKRPHGLMNPGGFDYEEWLFSKGIRATGYIVHPDTAQKIKTATWRYPVTQLREYLQQTIHQQLADQPTEGLITALVMGAQNGITREQWQVMRATGTNHLMAIAGVHIAFVSGFIYALVNFIWRRIPRLTLAFPAIQAAAAGALIAAFAYSALAGFALPTQRALIMLCVFMAGLFLRRTLHPWNAFLLALWIIVLRDPLSILSISFWLSFGAVFAIIYGITGRLKPRGLWWKYGRVQWVITIALIPFTLILFQQSSLISLIANLLSVPAVGIFVLPLCLSGAFFAMMFPTVGHGLLWLSAKTIAVIWMGLAWLGNLHGAVWQQNIPHTWMLIAAIIGILWLLAPRGFPARMLGLCWLSPMIFFHPAAPPKGEIKLTLLDVGQGLSTVVQTQHHALIFDTGPPMGNHEDAGGRVILPFLQSAGISKIDTLVISHGDADHIGGANTVLQKIPVAEILTSVPTRFPNRQAQACLAGQTWRWDEVTFRMLYPTPELLGENNNSSCVLRIETNAGAILFTGDIEKPAEEYLVTHAAAFLPANILVAPHHGSRTSSTLAFVSAVHPTTVLFPTGYKNRYQFPSKIVTLRYENIGAKLFNSADSGAILVETSEHNRLKIETQRARTKKIWHEH